MHHFFKTTIFILAIFTAANASAISTINLKEKTFSDGNEAYEKGDYQLAAEIYNQIREAGYTSWQLYYNLGNAYYRLDNISQAILHYERALRLAPNQNIIKDNLALARNKTQDNIEQLPKFFLWQWVDSIVQLTSPRGWRIAIVILFVLLCGAICIFLIARQYRIRRTMFIIGFLLLFLVVFSTFNATLSIRNATNKKEAIVTDPMLVVKGSPDSKSVDKFILHEGTKFIIDDEQDTWWQIKIADGKSGWINGGAERI